MYLKTQDWEAFEQRYRAAFINSISGHKPVFLVGTQDLEDQTNLAVFSSVFHLGSNPALFGMISRPHSVERHTLQNILDLKFYTLNGVKADFFEKAHQTSARYPKETSEFSAVGLTPIYDNNFKAPGVQESPVRMGLELVRTIDLEENQTVLVIGKLQYCFFEEDTQREDGMMDFSSFNLVGVQGLDTYFSSQLVGCLPYAKP